MRSHSKRPIQEDRQDRTPDGGPGQARTPKEPSLRDARLKAALKANMGRRKAQAKARGVEDTPGDIKGKD